MGAGFIFIGFLFLINPDLYTFDFLPDLFGYLLIAQGLKKLSYLEDRIATSRRFFHYLAVASAIKLACVPMTIMTTVENTRLTICFFFFVSELYLAFFATSNAFKGIQYLAIRKDGDIALKGFETARFFLVLFPFVKYIANFLHPATAIFFPTVDADPDVVESIRPTFLLVRNILFLVGVVASVSFGIYAARILKAYLNRCKSDEVFCKNLAEDYAEKVSENESMQKRLSIRNGFLYFFVAFLFLADLYLDDISFIPLFFYPLFIFLGILRLGKYLPLAKGSRAVSVSAFIVTLVTYVYRTVCLFRFDDAVDFAVFYVTSPVALILGFLSQAAVLAATVYMLLAVKTCAKVYTSYIYTVYFYAILVLVFFISDIAFAQYRYPSTFSVLPSVQWVLWVIGLYLHKKSLDDVRDEAEFQLM